MKPILPPTPATPHTHNPAQPMPWEREHDRAYAVPACITALCHDGGGLMDVSWHNDIAPTFALACHLALQNGDATEAGRTRPVGDDYEPPDVRLWVHHPDVAERDLEFPGMPRFCVVDHRAEQTSDHADTNDAYQAAVLYQSFENTEEAARTALAALLATATQQPTRTRRA